MARKLRNLVVDEISLVDKAANEGARVLLYKRQEDTPLRKRLRRMFDGVDYSKVQIVAPDDIDDDRDDDETPPPDDDEGTLHPKLEQFIAALQTANPSLSREVAVYFLLHNPHGQAMARYLASITKTRKEPPMNRADGLRDVAKQYGVARIAKMIVMEGTSHGISEAELTQLASEEFAKQKLPGERPNTTFARLYDLPENIELRKAFQIAKNTPAPLMAVESTQVDDSAAAYAKLQKMATELQRASPGLSEAQAFSKVFTDPANAAIAEKAHRRPQATTSYAWPR